MQYIYTYYKYIYIYITKYKYISIYINYLFSEISEESNSFIRFHLLFYQKSDSD